MSDSLNPMEASLAQFSLETLKIDIEQNPTVIRAAFPESVFKRQKFKELDLSAYFQQAFPLVSLHAIKTIINNNIGEHFIIPLEKAWLLHHRALHELIKAHSLKRALLQSSPSSANDSGPSWLKLPPKQAVKVHSEFKHLYDEMDTKSNELKILRS